MIISREIINAIHTKKEESPHKLLINVTSGLVSIKKVAQRCLIFREVGKKDVHQRMDSIHRFVIPARSHVISIMVIKTLMVRRL